MLGVGGVPVGAVPPGGVACAGAVGLPASPEIAGPAGDGAGAGDGGPTPAAPPMFTPGPGACAGGVGAGIGFAALASAWFKLPVLPPGSPVTGVGGSVAAVGAGAVIGEGDAIRFSTTLLKAMHPRVDPRVPKMNYNWALEAAFKVASIR